MLTKAQNALYWREWSAAKRALMPGRETWTKLEEDTRRHEITMQALGYDRSHLKFDNADFDLVLGALRAISKPGDLNAQLRQVRGSHRRAHFALDELMRKLRVDRNYVQAIVDQMNFEHAGSAIRHPALDELTVPELKKVIIALRKQGKRVRGKKTGAAPATPAISNMSNDPFHSSAHATPPAPREYHNTSASFCCGGPSEDPF